MTKYPIKTILLLLTGLSMFYFYSCREDNFDMSPDINLEFSTDSVLFDTVFTTVGSTTRFFKVYNRENSRVKISDLRLSGGVDSYFRINADGRSGTVIQDLEIGPRDSIFVFVEVTIDPLGQNLPLIISDSVVFTINQNRQNVKLVAWGQDANFIRPNFTDTINNIAYHVIDRNTNWNAEKPFVVYGLVVVAPGTELNISPGTNVHFHNNAGMIFLDQATLKAQGMPDAPIIFQGDRLDADYEDLPGQWGYIWLTAGSRGHIFENTVIKNATYGIIMDSIGDFTQPSLTLHNTVIMNMDQVGLELRGAWVSGSNLVVANCGAHAIRMLLGGNYDFKHITVANYYSLPGVIRQTPSLVFNNYYIDTTETVQIREFEKATFSNSIIYGSLQEEIGIDLFPEDVTPPFVFDHSLVRTQFHNDYPGLFPESIINEQPRFINPSDNDYRLLINSSARKAGSPAIALDVPLDILGRNRTDSVDIGAFQYYDIEEETEDDRKQ